MSYRYIGNKSRVLKNLMPVIGSIVEPGATVADLMCGTASVSEALRVAGYRVVASDIMTFAVQHARVRLTMDTEPSFAGIGGKTYREVLNYLQSLPPVQGYMVREYSPVGSPSEGHPPRKYFTAENAAKIDAIRAAIKTWEDQGLLTEQERALLRHDLVLAANKIANIAGTYGHFRSTWTNGSQNPLTLEPSNFIFGYRVDHVVLPPGPAEKSASQVTAQLCYLDPPYMKRQYAANYHILETLARGDEPPAIGLSGLRPWRDQYSDFCSKVKIRQAFTDIIQKMDCPQFLISYSEDGLVPKEELKTFFEQFGKVEVKGFTHQRFRSNSSLLGATLTEFLFHLTKI
jgi:adenine-specific DNA-methyltransferase